MRRPASDKGAGSTGGSNRRNRLSLDIHHQGPEVGQSLDAIASFKCGPPSRNSVRVLSVEFQPLREVVSDTLDVLCRMGSSCEDDPQGPVIGQQRLRRATSAGNSGVSARGYFSIPASVGSMASAQR